MEFGEDLDLTLVASGANFPDALTGAAYAGSRGVPVVLTRPGALPEAGAEQLERLNPARVAGLGREVAADTPLATERPTTAPGALPEAGAEQLERPSPARVAVLGGEVAVDTPVETELRTMFPGEEAQTFEGVGNGSGVFGELVNAADIPADGFTAADSALCLL